MKAFLEKGNRVVIAKAELDPHRLAVQFQPPEFKPAALQKCLCHSLVEIAPLIAGECSGLTAAGPAHLMQVKQHLQLCVEIVAIFATRELHGETGLQSPGITRKQWPKRRIQRTHVLCPRRRQIDNKVWYKREIKAHA